MYGNWREADAPILGAGASAGLRSGRQLSARYGDGSHNDQAGDDEAVSGGQANVLSQTFGLRLPQARLRPPGSGILPELQVVAAVGPFANSAIP